MLNFAYKGRGKNKELIEGQCESHTLEQAIRQLTEKGITLIDIHPAVKKKGWKDLLTLQIGKPKIKIQEMIIFCRQMHTLTKAGISILISIRRLKEIAFNPTFRDILHGIENEILAGKSFATCIKRYPDIFSSLFIELVHLGEESGHLDQSFLQIGEYLSLEYNTRKKFKAAIRYPLMVLITIFGAILVVNIFVIPNFSKLYSSFHTALPLPTIIMIKFSNFFSELLDIFVRRSGFIDGWHSILSKKPQKAN